MKYDEEYTKILLSPTWLGKKLLYFYTMNTIKYVKGNAIDFGCGTGNILRKMSKDSIGFDINQSSVDYCTKELGLDVSLYDPEKDKYQLGTVSKGKYKTFVSSHVMEHLSNPADVLRMIMNACYGKGIERIIIKVPCWRDFLRGGEAHVTFVDKEYLQANDLYDNELYRVVRTQVFPFRSHLIGKLIPYQELMLVYDRK